MTDWNRALNLMVREVCGPEDEFNPECNGDPDSLIGEEDESGFDEMSGWPDEDDDESDDDEEEGEDDGEETEG